MGLSYIDLNLANYIYLTAVEKGLGKDVVIAENSIVDYAPLIFDLFDCSNIISYK